ncbi:predicted protein [Histoplasma capsulatum G186AR]|uniref:Uncharacterized protein n=1 Tax=Ajellomyces capsulatus (strain G186AR / H82 / ATCC MYA-2454 / RMSCC 2432) TaxID=447093 RepID=C0NEW7_AJECG|nr:uncharacterized protein HCBG_01433 [Histoplasma capsulatum G186AR]EEH09788.1 predicted protein [Histoplasma capsulatum G186AR]
MATPPRFPLAKRSLDSLGLRRRHDPPPPQFFRPELRARASSSSALAQRAGSMRFATAIPESYIKMTRTPPKKRNNKKKNKKKGGRSKKAVIEDLPLSKRWVLAATNAFRPSRENDANQLQVKKLRRVAKNANLSPIFIRPVQTRPFPTPPERKSSLHSGAKTRSAQTGNRRPIEKPLPSTPEPEESDIPDNEEELPSSSKSSNEAEDTHLLQYQIGRPEVSERWPVLSPWKPPQSWESNYRRVEAQKNLQKLSSQNNDHPASPFPTENPPPLPPSKPLTPPRSTLRHSRLRITSNWPTENSQLDTIYQAAEPNDPMEKAPHDNPSDVLPNMISPGNPGVGTQPLEVNSESKIINPPMGNNENISLKPNPFRNRYRTVSSPQHSSHSRPQSGLREFSFEFSTDCPSPETTNNQNQIVADVMGDKEVSNSYTTPRSENAASKIPRISPQVLTPPTTGEVDGLKKIRSPSRRSSIPIPSRMVHARDKFDANALPVSPAVKTGRSSTSGYTGTIYEDEALGDQKGVGHQQTSQIVIANKVDPTESRGNDFTLSTALPNGYIAKELAAAGRSGPQLRISPEADKVIMGNMTNEMGESSQNHAGKRAKRLSGSKRLSGDSIFGSFTPKYLMHSQSNSSLNPSIASPTEGKVAAARDRKLKKARSTDATYAKKQHGKKFGTNPFYDDGIVPSPGVLNERYPFLNNSGLEPPRYSEADAASHGYKALPSSPLAESTTLIDDTDIEHSQLGCQGKHVVPSPLNSHTSTDQLRNKNENELSQERDASSTVRHRSSSQRLLHRSSRHRISEHGSHGKSKLNNVAAPSESAELTQKDAYEALLRNSSGSKEPSAKAGGVLSNFRGLFTKQKNDSATSNANANANANASSSTNAKRKDLERVKAANSGKLSTGSPTERSLSRHARGSRADKRVEDNPNTPSRDATVDHSRPTSDALTITSQMADSPALSGIRNVSALCIHVLDAARDEPNGAKKEKLIKLGKILVEVVNHANDAESAMLAALQAAKQAEIACALAKENALRLARVAQDWINLSNCDS